MRPTDPRELLHPVLPPETYQRLGIAPPRPPQLYGTGGPVSSAGTPYLTGRAVTGAPAPSPADAPAPSGPVPVPGTAPYTPAVPAGPPPAKDRSVAIVLGATVLIIAIILGATWYILANRSSAGDEQQIRDVIAAETKTLNDRDLSALIGVRCATDVAMLQTQFTAQTFAAEIDTLLGPDGRWEVVVGQIRVDGGAGTAEAEVTSTPVGSSTVVSKSLTDTTTLRKESGGWKVCVSSSRVR
ncbi:MULTISPECIES: nuclear transport factor 2 family protein [Tsukamurella]|uniref:Nuclear transport factor 2 family protein n=2 Tax=Tsukamurella TaxID=2060 RepID=A0A5C5S1K6_9ACTN|nr:MULTISPECIES: nuclear transport factor 2 family protein [Tsukamurella]NMD56454.1 nuclear transport factor 2 family protein [Tsukamurella columbiensis]TWS29199.1 nuclear transport factor 2 family protein [Tsukamurella conjunctivitidis]